MMRKKILVSVLLLFIISLSLTVYATSSSNGITPSTVERQREAVIETAEAYYRQGKQLQYDSYKKNLTATPEDATSNHPVYTVCSGLVYMSYRQALGEDLDVLEDLQTTKSIMKYASTADKKNVIFYYDSQSELYTKDAEEAEKEKNYHIKGEKGANLVIKDGKITDDSKKIFIDRLFSEKTNGKGIKAGDIFVYGKGGLEDEESFSGHAMLVYDVDEENKKIYLIEAGGESLEGKYGRYDVENHEDKIEPDGAVHIKENKELILLEDRLYPGKTHMCLIRIIPETNSDENKNVITDSALMRLKFPKLDIGKVITKVNGNGEKINQTFASINDTLTFKLTVRNKHTKDYKYPMHGEETVNVYEYNPEGETREAVTHGFSMEVIGHKVENAEKVDVTANYVVKATIDKTTGNLIWSIDKGLAAGDALIIQYEVKLKESNSDLDGKIVEFNGFVKKTKTEDDKKPRACIATSRIETLMGKRLTDAESEELTTGFMYIYNKTVNGREFTERQKQILEGANSGRKFIEQLYSIILDIDLGITKKESPSGDVKKFICYNKQSGKEEQSISRYALIDKELKYLYSNYYGLRLSDKKKDDYVNGEFSCKASLSWDALTGSELMDRARTLTPEMLLNGDVILNYTEHVYKDAKGNEHTKFVDKAYIFFDGTLYRFKRDGENISFETITEKTLKTFLNDLVGEHYIILRPYYVEK